jgi:hypothetical protein
MAQRVPGAFSRSSRPTHWEYFRLRISNRECARQLGIKFSLCNQTLEIALADKMKQLFTRTLNVIAEQQGQTGWRSGKLIGPSMSDIAI